MVLSGPDTLVRPPTLPILGDARGRVVPLSARVKLDEVRRAQELRVRLTIGGGGTPLGTPAGLRTSGYPESGSGASTRLLADAD